MTPPEPVAAVPARAILLHTDHADPEVPTGVSLSKAQNESLAKMAGERKHQLLQMSHAHLRPCRSPGCNHHRRTARDAPASKRLAPWVPHHIWKRARLTRTARGAPGSRTARGPTHGVPRIGLARVRLRSVPVGPQRCLRTSG